ncbi:galactokinase [Leptospira perolatii]|uniref:Galactokinase n=1 Tax=Leptospira perolatii TaxID=2023191 RepID=A0A2M9ZSJ3_9LEPT|nr:galactokinase [Leptospira perolatii]PJZ71509.1 galactokinase [Leptospira perolatii]PJZ75042.1 galactokinase [Leptospira perolatii]
MHSASFRELSQKLDFAFGESSVEKQPRYFSAPGRINIIGEHVDYAGGIVLPAAINLKINLAIRRNESSTFRFYSIDMNETLQTDRIEYSSEYPWANYILGIISEAKRIGKNVSGFDAAFSGNIPQGAGLSSSAALEVVVAFALSEIFQWNFTKTELALLGQAAENRFVGVQCGIMDQFVISVARENTCISLDTDTLEFTYQPLDLNGHEFYLIDSKVKHSLKDSAYNQRRSSVESATLKLQKSHPNLKSLYDSDPNWLTNSELSAEEAKRAKHVQGERRRTELVIQNLKSGDLESLGKLLFDCHRSLSEEFEVSCPQTDSLVDLLKSQKVTGARMIGGGFGGCILVLDKIGRSETVWQNIQKSYFQIFGIQPALYRISISGGAREEVSID